MAYNMGKYQCMVCTSEIMESTAYTSRNPAMGSIGTRYHFICDGAKTQPNKLLANLSSGICLVKSDIYIRLLVNLITEVSWRLRQFNYSLFNDFCSNNPKYCFTKQANQPTKQTNKTLLLTHDLSPFMLPPIFHLQW